MTRSRGIVLAFALIVACLILLGYTSEFLVDWTWFSSLGFLGVFWTIIGAKSALFAAVFVATAIVVWVNGALAFRDIPHNKAGSTGSTGSMGSRGCST